MLAPDEGRGYHNDVVLFFLTERPCDQIIQCQDAIRLYNSGPASHVMNRCNSQTFKTKRKPVRYHEENSRHEITLEIIGVFF